MGQNLKDIIITRQNGDRVPMNNRRTATAVTSAKQNIGLNAEDTVDITVTSAVPQTYNIGDQITVFGRDYKMSRLPSVKKSGAYGFEYTLQYEGVQYDLYRVIYDLTIDTTSCELQDVQGDALTGNLKRFMTVLVANANRVFPDKWALGACPDTDSDKTLTFSEGDNCLSVLQSLCSEDNFNVEFEIVQTDGVYTISLYDKVGQTLPYTFAYGHGNGLYELNRENVSSSNIVTRLKVYGSTENITSKYRADRLCLPGCTKGQSYIEKADAVAKYGIFEGRKYFDDIKPTWTGTVESKDGEYAFVDTTFPFDLNETDTEGNTKYLINGTSAKVHFNTGNLAGYDFEVKSYDHATHKFTLIKTTDDRGDVFPSETSAAFQFAVGNTYKVTDIAYSDAIEAQAEAKLQEEANKYYDQNCQPKVQYGLSVSKAWLENLVGSPQSTTNVFAVGDYLHIIDADINVDKSVRIKSFARDVLDPYSYTLTISDTVTTSITNRVISDLVEIDKVVTINNMKDPTRARNNWRTSRELLNMVFDTDGDYYTEKIKPLSIDTQLLTVGAKSMQFGLTNTVFQPNYNGNANAVSWQGGVLTHYTIKDDDVMSWNLADGSVTLTSDAAFYIYAKCERAGTTGTIVFDQTQHKTEEDAMYYWLLIGTLSSVDTDDKVRSIALTYGFSMVNGRFIKTGRIESTAGTCYFDLDNNEIGGNITIKSGSSGYANLSDKPDLSKYTLYSEFQVTANKVSSNTTKIDTINNTISTAGWITAADGNTLYAAKSLENGNNIISYINQTATTTTINASKINLKGQVTFSMFDSSLQTTVNGKLNSGDVGSLAYLSSVSKSNLASDLSNLIDGKANSSSLGSLAYKSSVSSAMLDSTVISGGYILTTLIDVDSLYVKHLKASLGYITVTNDYSGLNINRNDGTNNRNVAKVTSSGFYCCSSTGSELDSVFSPTELYLNGGAGTAQLVNGGNGGGLHLAKGNQKVTAETWGAYGLTLIFAGLPTSTTGLVSGQVWRDGTTLRIKA